MTDLELFTIKDGKVVPSKELINIPELKAVVDEHPEHHMEMFNYLHYMHYPRSAYANLTDEEKEEILEDTFVKGWTTEDRFFLIAEELIEKMYNTPTKQFFLNAKLALEKLGHYLASATITDGKEGNAGVYSMAMTRIGKTIEDFKKLEKMYQDESKGNSARGNKSVSYDDL